MRIGSFTKIVFSVGLLAAQVVGIGLARGTPKRYFCWAPNDYVTEYVLRVQVGGRSLTAEEIAKRYHLPEPFGVYENPAEHVIALIQQFETSYGKNDHANVALNWSLNGHGPQRSWAWPTQR